MAANNKSILITGATGFIGKYIVEQALKNNFEVFVAIRKNSTTTRIDHLKFNTILVDYSTEGTITDSFPSNLYFDCVVHNAGVKSCFNQSDYYKYNVELTKSLCAVLRKRKILKGNFIYISSLAALGPSDSLGADITEYNAEQPISTYGQSKLLAEKEVLAANFKSIILRPTAVYGEGTTDYNDLIKVVKKGMAIYLTQPSQILSFIHAEDLARAIFMVNKNKSENKIFHVSDGEDYTLASVYEIIAAALGVQLKFRFRIPFMFIISMAHINQYLKRIFKIENALDSVEKAKEVTALNWRCSSERLIKDTGFTASHSLKEIIEY